VPVVAKKDVKKETNEDVNLAQEAEPVLTEMPNSK
jgi:hypothetical protein